MQTNERLLFQNSRGGCKHFQIAMECALLLVLVNTNAGQF